MRTTAAIVATATVLLGATLSTQASTAATRTGSATHAAASASASPIQHVVLIYQENHSFDNVLGELCADELPAGRCDGATTGLASNGNTIPLSREPDVVPNVGHTTPGQITAIDGGRMDGWDKVSGCSAPKYACYTQTYAADIPNLASLATNFVIADRFRAMDTIPSFGAHLELAAQTLDGFYAPDDPKYNPLKLKNVPPKGTGWGCDSNLDALYGTAAQSTWVPSCVPAAPGVLDPTKYPNGGAYRATPVQPTPTIFDRLQAAGVTWKLYTTNRIWSICPTFAGCLYTSEATHMVKTKAFTADAASSSLPNFSIVLPDGATGKTSQHNGTSMTTGDNFIGSTVSAIENGPNWDSTAIFITYDDCGCFYDHVPPTAGMGVRLPMVIVSPYAKPSYTDHTDADLSSVMAFMEHQLAVDPVIANGADGTAYDFSNAFDFSQAPSPPIPMVQRPLAPSVAKFLKQHPPADDDT